MKQSKSSGFILSQRHKPSNSKDLKHINHIELSHQDFDPEVYNNEAYKDTILSMYSDNKISKKEILDNILEVEQENYGPEHLKMIAYKLQKKLEEKAEK
jgi:hypothetical protein